MVACSSDETVEAILHNRMHELHDSIFTYYKSTPKRLKQLNLRCKIELDIFCVWLGLLHESKQDVCTSQNVSNRCFCTGLVQCTVLVKLYSDSEGTLKCIQGPQLIRDGIPSLEYLSSDKRTKECRSLHL